MKNSTKSSSLILTPDGGILLGIEKGNSRPFRLLWSRSFSKKSPLPGSFLRGISGLTSKTAMLLSSDSVSTLQATLPPLNQTETRLALLGSIAQEENNSGVKWALDYHIWPPRRERRSTEGKRDISVAYARHDFLQRETEKAHSIGIRPTVMVPGYIALDSLYRQSLPETERRNHVWNLVYLGRDERFLCVGDSGGLLFTRSLPHDLSEGSESEEYFHQLATQVERSNFYARQAERSLVVEKIILCGEPQLVHLLAGKLAEQEGPPSEIWHPQGMFEQDKEDLPADSILPLAVAVTALGKGLFNLALEKSRTRILREVRNRVLTTTGILAVLIVPLLLMGEFWTLAAQKTVLEDGRQQLSLAQGRAESAAVAYLRDRTLQSRRQNIRDFGLDRPAFGDLLRNLGNKAPSKVKFKDITLTRGSPGDYRLFIEGTANGRSSEHAQGTFMCFTDSLNNYSILLGGRAPQSLVIDGQERDGEGKSRVEFALEYKVKEEVRR
ncbi:MAG: hypothetical protein KOO60_07675 [Gemmatimonadales bacterium]|nr:hypothetical protein [Gemmatimonadales bacterium]